MLVNTGLLCCTKAAYTAAVLTFRDNSIYFSTVIDYACLIDSEPGFII